jgi:ribosomal protein S18 acetylase RimI-like enzyme
MNQNLNPGIGFTPLDRSSESTLPPVVPADPGDVGLLADVIADAFFDLPPSVWLVAEPDMRIEILRNYFALQVEHAFKYGHVDMLEDKSAVAVWFHHTSIVPEPDDYPRRLRAACKNWTERFLRMEQLLHAGMPEDPLHHLAFLAVSTGKRGTGRGTALLAHHLADLDRAGLLAYLEAASKPLTGYYEQVGFHRARPLLLPDDGPAFWPMVRLNPADELL